MITSHLNNLRVNLGMQTVQWCNCHQFAFTLLYDYGISNIKYNTYYLNFYQSRKVFKTSNIILTAVCVLPLIFLNAQIKQSQCKCNFWFCYIPLMFYLYMSLFLNYRSGTMDSKQDDEKLRLADRENSANKKFQIPKINTQLLPSKAYYFFYHGTHGCLFAYLSVFYKQMGMNAIRVGILSALKPFINSVFAPIGGALADKFRKRKLILLLSMAIWAVGMLCIGLLPTPTALHICPLELQPQQNFSTCNPEVTDAIKTKYVSDIGWLYDADWISNTFLVIAMCLIVAEAFYGPSSPLGDTAVITSLGEANRHEYARQRSWGGLGAGLL